MNYQLSGKVKVIQNLQTFPSGFSKRELVVTLQDGSYTQDISLEFLKEKADLLSDLTIGEEVILKFNIRGREYNGNYFNNLTAWKLEITGKGHTSVTSASPPFIH